MGACRPRSPEFPLPTMRLEHCNHQNKPALPCPRRLTPRVCAPRPFARESCRTLMGQAMAVHAAGVGIVYSFTTCNTELCNVFQTPPVLQMPSPPPAPPPVLPPPPFPPFPPQPPATAGTAFIYSEADFQSAIADASVVRFVVMSARITLSGSALNLTRPSLIPNVFRDVLVESGGRFPCPSDVAWSKLPAEARPALCPAVIDAGGLSNVIALEWGSVVLRDLVVMNGRRADNSGGGCLNVAIASTLIRLEGVIFSKCYSSGARGPLRRGYAQLDACGSLVSAGWLHAAVRV